MTLVVGVTIGFREKTGEGRFLTLGLTALASLLSGYIAKVFFKSAEFTGEHLREFYKEPCRTGQMLAIERVAALEPRAGDGESGHQDGIGLHTREELRRMVVEGLMIHQLMPDSQKKAKRKLAKPPDAGSPTGTWMEGGS